MYQKYWLVVRYHRLFPHAFLCWQARAWMSLTSQTPICRPLAMPVSSERLCQGKLSKWRWTVMRWRSEKLAAAENKTLGPWHVLPVLWPLSYDHWAATSSYNPSYILQEWCRMLQVHTKQPLWLFLYILVGWCVCKLMAYTVNRELEGVKPFLTTTAGVDLLSIKY